MLCNFGSNITIDFNDLKLVKTACKFTDMLISNFAIGIPLGCEIDYDEGKPVASEIVIQNV
jgi:hypothetical protein